MRHPIVSALAIVTIVGVGRVDAEPVYKCKSETGAGTTYTDVANANECGRVSNKTSSSVPPKKDLAATSAVPTEQFTLIEVPAGAPLPPGAVPLPPGARASDYQHAGPSAGGQASAGGGSAVPAASPNSAPGAPSGRSAPSTSSDAGGTSQGKVSSGSTPSGAASAVSAAPKANTAKRAAAKSDSSEFVHPDKAALQKAAEVERKKQNVAATLVGLPAIRGGATTSSSSPGTTSDVAQGPASAQSSGAEAAAPTATNQAANFNSPTSNAARAAANAKVESTGFDASLCAVPVPTPHQVQPIVKVSDFGAKGDGITDDTEAINKAIQSVRDGGTVVLESGKVYLKTKVILLDRPGVKLWGYGSLIFHYYDESKPAELSISMRAPQTGVYGVTMVSNLRKRLRGHPYEAAVYVASSGAEVIDNRFEYTGNGVLVERGVKFLIARNVIFRTTSDALHITQGSSDGRILCNVVRESGDDMIAVVNYGLGEPTIGGFLIEANDVAGNYWGRGITVVGGSNVTIRGNTITRTNHGAGILINSESHFKTANVRQVVVEGNTIREVQTTAPTHNLLPYWRRTGQGAIDINGQAGQLVADVTVRRNKIEGAMKDGIFLRGAVCNIRIEQNEISRVGRDSIRREDENRSGCAVSCASNLANGQLVPEQACYR